MGTAINFGGNDYFTRTDDALLDLTDPLSIIAWMKRNDTDNSLPRAIVSKQAGSYYFRQQGGFLELLRSQQASLATSSITVNDTDWHMLAVTKSGSDIDFFKDGVIDGSPSVSGSTINTNNSDLQIGAEQGGERMTASLDEIAIFATKLAEADITAIYAARLGASFVPRVIIL